MNVPYLQRLPAWPSPCPGDSTYAGKPAYVYACDKTGNLDGVRYPGTVIDTHKGKTAIAYDPCGGQWQPSASTSMSAGERRLCKFITTHNGKRGYAFACCTSAPSDSGSLSSSHVSSSAASSSVGPSESRSVSQSASGSLSGSVSQSVSGSRSGSQSVSTSVSQSVSGSVSQSVSESLPAQLCGVYSPASSESSSSSHASSSSNSLASQSSASSASQAPTTPIDSPCCHPITIPSVLYATFDGVLAGLGSVAMTYDSVSQTWVGKVSACGGTVTVTFSCTNSPPGQFLLETSGAAAGFWGFGGGIPTSCSPFLWGAFSGFVTSTGCGNGNVNATVTA